MKDESIVLDSSVIAALFFPEPYSDWAEDIVRNYDYLYTIDLAYAEVMNVAWKKIVRFKLDQNTILTALDKALGFISNVCEVIEAKTIWKNAIKIAIETEITSYDALFLALSLMKKIKLTTIDKKLAEKLMNSKYKEIIIQPFK